MKVSIIIPVYNVEPYIERCLLSALNQTYQNIEIILVDDCGIDNSMAIAKQIIENHKNGYKVIILKHGQNQGLSAARNTGINAATSEYLYFFDSDDEIALDSMEILVNQSDECEVIIGGVFTYAGELYVKNKANIFIGDEIKTAYFDGLIYDMAWNKLINRQFLIANGLFFEHGLIHEDYPWSFFVAMKCNKLKIIENPTYLYNIREGSLNTNFTVKNVNHYITGFNKTESFLIQNKYVNNQHFGYLINKKLGFKILSFKANISYSNFTSLSFSKYKYPVQTDTFKIFCKSIILKMPVWMQYIILKCLYRIKKA